MQTPVGWIKNENRTLHVTNYREKWSQVIYVDFFFCINLRWFSFTSHLRQKSSASTSSHLDSFERGLSQAILMTVLNCKEAYFWKQRHKTIWLQRRWLFVQHSWIASTLRYFLYKLIGIKSYDQNKIKTVQTSAKVNNNNCIHKLQKLKGTKHSIFQNPDSNNCWTAEKKLEQQKKKCGVFLGFLFACFFLFTGKKIFLHNLLFRNQVIYVVHSQVRYLNGLGFFPLTLAHVLESASLSSLKERVC